MQGCCLMQEKGKKLQSWVKVSVSNVKVVIVMMKMIVARGSMSIGRRKKSEISFW